MNSEAAKALSLMTLSMPQQNSLNVDAYLAALKLSADGCCDDAIIEAAQNCMTGKAMEVTRGFAPSPDKFGEYVTQVHHRKEAVKKHNERLALPKASYQNQPNPSQLEKSRQHCLAKGMELIELDITLDKFKQRSGAGEFCAGSVWVASGEVFAPKNGVNQQ